MGDTRQERTSVFVNLILSRQSIPRDDDWELAHAATMLAIAWNKEHPKDDDELLTLEWIAGNWSESLEAGE